MGTSSSKGSKTAPEDDDTPQAFSHVLNRKTWAGLSYVSRDRVFAESDVLKFVVDIRPIYERLEKLGQLEDQEVDHLSNALLSYNPKDYPNPCQCYFINSGAFPYHYAFLSTNLGLDMGLERFNNDNYFYWPREWLIGTIAYYHKQDLCTFELWPGDIMPAPGMIFMSRMLREFAKEWLNERPLYMRISSAIHQENADQIKDTKYESELLTKHSDDIFGAIEFQPITTTISYGTLRILPDFDGSNLTLVGPEDILLTKEIPNDIPYVRGLITEAIQTPLCHVALLCANRRIPNMAHKNAATILQSLDGQHVRYEVTMQGYSVTPSDPNEYNSWLNQKEREEAERPPVVVEFDDSVAELIHVRTADQHPDYPLLLKNVGAKAAQTLISHSLNLNAYFDMSAIEPAFIIPFQAYTRHVPTFQSPTPSTPQFLADFRTQIEGLTVQETLLDAIMAALQQWDDEGIFQNPAIGGVILRSSTNVEDLPGFNGAGLYLSKSIRTAELSREAVAVTLKQVWASLWNDTGFQEREAFKLDQQRVAMAVLVMPFYANIVGNGVMITSNPFRKAFRGCYFNTQRGNVRVTDGSKGVKTEQVLVYDMRPPTLEFITNSSFEGGALLTQDMVVRAWVGFWTLHRRLSQKTENPLIYSSAVDVEYLLLQHGDQVRFCLLQCRPTTIVHHDAPEH